MKVNGKEYGYTIEPRFDKVRAEIYYVSDVTLLKDRQMHIRLLDKEFGSVFRKPKRIDYENAKKWADEQMDCIFKANSLTK